jgi:hypothetical protein
MNVQSMTGHSNLKSAPTHNWQAYRGLQTPQSLSDSCADMCVAMCAQGMLGRKD